MDAHTRSSSAPSFPSSSYDMMEQNKYTFEVAKSATKLQVRRRHRGDLRCPRHPREHRSTSSLRRSAFATSAGKTRTWKKAIVTVAEGETIEIFGTQA